MTLVQALVTFAAYWRTAFPSISERLSELSSAACAGGVAPQATRSG